MKRKDQIGIRFKKWRVKTGRTQAQLGKEMKLSQNFLSAFENGNTKLSQDTFQFLGLNLNLDLNWLLTGKSRN